MINDDVRKLIAQLNKKFGEDTIVVASEMAAPDRFTSGSLTLDIALGGGWPANQWVEVYGKESHGKTAITLKTVAANQERDKNFTTLWIAAEHFDRDQAMALGVDLERVVVVPTQDMEFAYQTVIDFLEDKNIDCVVIDSYPALIPGEEDEKDMDENSMALGARLTGKFFRKAGKAIHRATDGSERPVLGIFINQQRDKIGGWAPNGIIPQTTPGGNAKNYAFYTRVEVKRDEYIEVKREGQKKPVKVGQVIACTTVKNKSSAPGQVAKIDFYFRDAPELGFERGEYDAVKQVIVMGLIFQVIERRGGYYYYGEHQWRGMPELETAIRSEPDLLAEIEVEVMNSANRPDLVDQITEDAINSAEKAGEQKIKRSRKQEE